jgi:hypothetical protein
MKKKEEEEEEEEEENTPKPDSLSYSKIILTDYGNS